MKIGTYYYPEQWPKEQWERDFDNIAKLGLQIVHMGEFAWFEMEPKPGEFHFDWLSHCSIWPVAAQAGRDPLHPHRRPADLAEPGLAANLAGV